MAVCVRGTGIYIYHHDFSFIFKRFSPSSSSCTFGLQSSLHVYNDNKKDWRTKVMLGLVASVKHSVAKCVYKKDVG